MALLYPPENAEPYTEPLSRSHVTKSSCLLLRSHTSFAENSGTPMVKKRHGGSLKINRVNGS